MKEHETGVSATEVSRKHGFAEGTLSTWKSKFGGMQASVAKAAGLSVWSVRQFVIRRKIAMIRCYESACEKASGYTMGRQYSCFGASKVHF
ncbi:MAG: transposase [Proteobacteria bacterium]|nr:transposase [Pseudomonadota bacterium]